MTEALLVSNALLWVAILALGAVVVALTRQIGVLHERIAPVGALAVGDGPEVGAAAPELTVDDLAGAVVHVGGPAPSGARTLLFFLSPTCPVCETLLPTLARISRTQGDRLRIVYASDGEPGPHAAFRERHGLERDPYVLSRDLGIAYQVAKLPYAVLIDADGTLRARGLVNTREHLESLFEAERLRVASVQDYLEREERQPPPLEVVAHDGVTS